MSVPAAGAGRLRYMEAWVGERTGRHEKADSGGGLYHDCGRDISDLTLIYNSAPTRTRGISCAGFCLKKKQQRRGLLG